MLHRTVSDGGMLAVKTHQFRRKRGGQLCAVRLHKITYAVADIDAVHVLMLANITVSIPVNRTIHF